MYSNEVRVMTVVEPATFAVSIIDRHGSIENLRKNNSGKDTRPVCEKLTVMPSKLD
jgi:hypothetical protein